jgi:hypothetical protein
MEAMVFCAAVRLLEGEIRVVCAAQITLYGVSFQGSRLRAEAFCVPLTLLSRMLFFASPAVCCVEA